MSELNEHIAETPENSGRRTGKRRRRRILVNALAVLLGGGLIALLGFAGTKQAAVTCWKLEVKVEPAEGHFFVTEKTVEELAQPENAPVVGKRVKEINIDDIHRRIMKNPAVASAEVFTTVDGRCVVNVRQRQPIARFFNEDGKSYFIDKDGFMVPAEGGIPVKLPVFVGAIREKQMTESVLEKRKNEEWARQSLLDDMYFLTVHIRKSEFLMALIDHIYIDGSRNVQLIPRVGDHRIFIGSVNDLNEKFKKLQTFYASALQTHDLNRFSTIHLEYRGQVVCEKKTYY